LGASLNRCDSFNCRPLNSAFRDFEWGVMSVRAISGRPSTAFVLGGGGSLGAVQVGMMRALLEQAIGADLLVGSSVGAINAAYFAANPTLEGPSGLEAIWRHLKRSNILCLGWRGLFGFLGQRRQAAKAGRISCNFGAGVMTRVWPVKNGNGEVLSHFTSASPLEVGRKLVPAHYDAFRLQVSSSYRELFERAVKQILKDQDWRIVREPRKSQNSQRRDATRDVRSKIAEQARSSFASQSQ
jgi:hypothetical protein